MSSATLQQGIARACLGAAVVLVVGGVLLNMPSPRARIEQMAGVTLPPSTRDVRLHVNGYGFWYLLGEYDAVARFTITRDELPQLQRALALPAQMIGANTFDHAQIVREQYNVDWYAPDTLIQGCCLYSNIVRSTITPAAGTAEIQRFFVDTRDPQQIHVYVALSAT